MAAKSINRNPALQTSFKLEFPRFPEFNYFVTETELPGLSMAGTDTPYKNNYTSMPSNSIMYDPLNVTMIVSEDYSNYNRIRLWMHEVRNTEPVVDVLQDFTLTILNSNKNPYMYVTFYGGYPTMIGAIPLMTGTTDEMPAMCSMTFRYEFYDVKFVK